MLDGGSAGAESGAGLDEVGLGLHGDFAGGGNLLVVEKAGLDDDLDASVVRSIDDVPNLAAYRLVVPVDEFAEVHYHIDLVGAVVDGHLGFVALGVRVGCPGGEAHDCGDGDV